MRNRRLFPVLSVFVLALTVPLPCVWADGADVPAVEEVRPVRKKCMIGGYQITINGTTHESAIRKRIIPSGDEIFDDEEVMVAALERKRNALYNLRVFKSVSYTYRYTNESDSLRFYQVNFVVRDASSSLPLPIIKYDSNYGFKAGARLYDRNLFGQLADLYLNVEAQQNDGSFRDGEYVMEFDVNDLTLWGDVTMDISSDLDYDKDDVGDSTFDFNIATKGLKLDHKNLSLETSLSLIPYQESSSDWRVGTVANRLVWGPFAMEIGGYTFTNYIAWHPYAPIGDGKSTQTYNEGEYLYKTNEYDYRKLVTSSALQFHGLKLKGHRIDTSLNVDTEGTDDGVLSKMVVSEHLGFNINLGVFKWYNDFYQKNTMYPREQYYYNPNDSLLYEASLGMISKLTYSDINWVMEDFRKGYEVDVHFAMEKYLNDMYGDISYRDTSWRWVDAQFIAFPFASSWFNPSLRLTMAYNSKGNENRYFYPDAPGDELSDYMRGIRDSNDAGEVFEDINGDDVYDVAYEAVLNLNWTFKFVDLGFGHTLINPFIDIGVVRRERKSFDAGNGYADDGDLDDAMGKTHWLWSGGIEGIGILKDHPAYPVRLSIGLNFGDIFDKIRGGGHGLEYEIFFGMYHFF